MRSQIFVTALVALCLMTSQVSAHPADGYPPVIKKDSFHLGNGYPAAWSKGDIIFYGPEHRPAVADLTAADWYILGGATGSSLGNGALLPWGTEVFTAVNAYYQVFGTIPAVLNDVELRKIPRYRGRTDAQLAVFRSPLTNRWPRLDQTTITPGDLYIRPLTNAEVHYYGGLDSHLNAIWFSGTEPGHTGNYRLKSPVFYYRIYGSQGVLVQNFKYLFE